MANGVNALQSTDRAMIVITHYQRFLITSFLTTSTCLFEGRIVKSGGKELALELEEKGYDWIEEQVQTSQPTGV